jgi:hypothetical protein
VKDEDVHPSRAALGAMARGADCERLSTIPFSSTSSDLNSCPMARKNWWQKNLAPQKKIVECCYNPTKRVPRPTLPMSPEKPTLSLPISLHLQIHKRQYDLQLQTSQPDDSTLPSISPKPPMSSNLGVMVTVTSVNGSLF